jgi:hypothetical protein
MTPNFVAVVVALMTSLQMTSSAKILLVTANCNSHILYFSRLGVELSKLGHVTRLLAPSNARRPDFVVDEQSHDRLSANFTYTTFPVDDDVPFLNTRRVSQQIVDVALSKSRFDALRILSEFWQESNGHHERDCTRLLENERLMADVRSAGYEFVITDPVPVPCCYTLPYALRIPYATLSISIGTMAYRVPRLSSFASPLLGFTDRMSFGERLATLLVDLSLHFRSANQTTYYVEKYASERPPVTIEPLFLGASLWFFLEDLTVGFPMPQMPNTVAVGDVLAGRPGRPLTGELDEFLRGSTNGVVVVSFGSFLEFLPWEIISKFCDSFRKLHRTDGGVRVVWKLNDRMACNGSADTLILPWIPQNDLLADSRVHLLITHGGFNSVIESVYHAKPLIVFPFSIDQPANAAAAESKGYAVRMNIADFTSDELVANIEKVLNNATYRENAELASRILRDRPETAAERVGRMIEHVIKYGDRHLRTGAFDLSLMQFMMFDIFAAILLAVISTILLAAAVGCYVLRKCSKLCKRQAHDIRKSKLQ